MSKTPAGLTFRKIRASWRDTLILLREFRQPLLLFTLAVIGSGWLYYSLSILAGQRLSSPIEDIYITLTLSFFQPTINFPSHWYLQIFFFIMPLIGVGILAQGLADFAIMLFNRRARGKEWEMAVASTFENHIILVGLGHLGYNVVKKLCGLNQEVVVIEIKPDADLALHVREAGVPVIEDDASRESILLAAGVPRAKAIILCTQDDSLNLRIALKSRSLNPKIEVVVRIFDDDFATSLQKQFGFRAFSATGMAAPLFAAIAADLDITPPLMVEGEPHHLARVQITPNSKLKTLTVQEIEEKFRVSSILLRKKGQPEFHPRGEEYVQPGQVLAIFGKPEQINQIIHENQR